MNLSKKQKVIIWVTVLLALFFLGLKGDSFTGANQFDYWNSIELYGISLSTWNLEPHSYSFFGLLWDLAKNRSYVVAAIIIIGLTALITSKSK